MIPSEIENQSAEFREEINIDFHSIIRFQKSVIINSEPVGPIDGKVVAPEYYNNFNYGLLNREWVSGKLVLGVVSANPGEGKTLVASNLSVSLAMAYQRDTVIVDMNIQRPRLHSVFGTPAGPGFLDALQNNNVFVDATEIKKLYVLPSGNYSRYMVSTLKLDSPSLNVRTESREKPIIGLDKMPEFRNIIFSLEQFFDIIIVDLPSVNDQIIPNLFMNQLNGLIVVVTAGTTKHKEIEKLLQQIDNNKILGFVMNKASL